MVNFGWEMRLAITEGGGHIASPKKVHFMADVANKYPENTGGKYYVDNQCIDWDSCRETAPDNFKRNDDGGYSFVYKQPENSEEEARCKEAKEGCPVEAIGDNGGESILHRLVGKLVEAQPKGWETCDSQHSQHQCCIGDHRWWCQRNLL